MRGNPSAPEGTFPNLNEVRQAQHPAPEAPLEIPSTIRSGRRPNEPRNGGRVGRESGEVELGTANVIKRRNIKKTTRSHHSTPNPPLLDDVFIQNFFTWSVARTWSSAEATYWKDVHRSAYANGQGSIVLAARELGKTLFESTDYALRNRNNHWYVYDLYKSYLMRDPDAGGWAFWEGLVPSLGREAVRRAFDESTEFINLVNTITPNGSVTSAVSSLVTARVDPFNQPNSGLLSRDASWSITLLSLPGRASLDLGLSLSYSSAVWTKSVPYLYFDEDAGFPSPGFRLGFPTVQEKFFDAQVGDNVYVLITGGGSRVELRQVGTTNVYEAADSSYLQLTDNGTSLLVRSTDGTQMNYVKFESEWRCTQIKDRNGNYITANYNPFGDPTTVTDTLGRVIIFNYDTNSNLLSITQNWNGTTHTWVTFGWGTHNMQSGFTGTKQVGAPNGTNIPVVSQVGLHDGSRYNFEYFNNLQASIIRRYSSDNVQRAYTAFTYDGALADCPRLSNSRVWADNWTGINGVPTEITTQYSSLTNGAQMIAPDGTVYKEFYGSGWQKGLTTTSEVWSAGVKQKWTTVAWTQDNTGVSYRLNPRPTETNLYDAAGNRRRVAISYHPSFGLPLQITEYNADAVTVLRYDLWKNGRHR